MSNVELAAATGSGKHAAAAAASGGQSPSSSPFAVLLKRPNRTAATSSLGAPSHKLTNGGSSSLSIALKNRLQRHQQTFMDAAQQQLQFTDTGGHPASKGSIVKQDDGHNARSIDVMHLDMLSGCSTTSGTSNQFNDFKLLQQQLQPSAFSPTASSATTSPVCPKVLHNGIATTSSGATSSIVKSPAAPAAENSRRRRWSAKNGGGLSTMTQSCLKRSPACLDDPTTSHADYSNQSFVLCDVSHRGDYCSDNVPRSSSSASSSTSSSISPRFQPSRDERGRFAPPLSASAGHGSASLTTTAAASACCYSAPSTPRTVALGETFFDAREYLAEKLRKGKVECSGLKRHSALAVEVKRVSPLTRSTPCSPLGSDTSRRYSTDLTRIVEHFDSQQSAPTRNVPLTTALLLQHPPKSQSVYKKLSSTSLSPQTGFINGFYVHGQKVEETRLVSSNDNNSEHFIDSQQPSWKGDITTVKFELDHPVMGPLKAPGGGTLQMVPSPSLDLKPSSRLGFFTSPLHSPTTTGHNNNSSNGSRSLCNDSNTDDVISKGPASHSPQSSLSCSPQQKRFSAPPLPVDQADHVQPSTSSANNSQDYCKADSLFDDVCKTVLANCLRETTSSAANSNNQRLLTTTTVALSSVSLMSSTKPAHRPPSGMCTFVGVGANQATGCPGEPCRQRCISGYKFCIRHILNDPRSPYKACEYLKEVGAKRVPCMNAVVQQMDTDSRYCATHSIMMGLRQPKTKKPKPSPAFPAESANLLPSDQHRQLLSPPKTPLGGAKSVKRTAKKPVVSQQQTQQLANGDVMMYQNNISEMDGSRQFMTNGPSSSNFTTTVVYDEKNHQQYFIQHQHQQPMLMPQYNAQSPQFHQMMPPGGNGLQQQQQQHFEFSRPESQVSSVTSLGYPPTNGYGGQQSPQSPWKQYSTPPGLQHHQQQMDLTKAHPELAAKLGGHPQQQQSMAMDAHHHMTTTGGFTDFDDNNTITLFNIPESSIICPSGGPSANYNNPQINSPSFLVAQSPSHHQNLLLRPDDPFLGPPGYQAQPTVLYTSQQPAIQMGANLLSPVPSDLSVESVGSHSSYVPQQQQQQFMTAPAYQPSPSPQQHQSSATTTYYVLGPVGPNGQVPVSSMGGAGGHGQFAYPFSPPPSSNNGQAQFTTPPPGATLQLVAQSQIQQPPPLMMTSPSQRVPSTGVAPGPNVGRRLDIQGPAMTPTMVAQSAKTETTPTISAAKHLPSTPVKADLMNSPASTSASIGATSSVGQQKHSTPAVASVPSVPSVAASTQFQQSSGTTPATTVTKQLKKVIRLKPKKRRQKMNGKYRQVPLVGQMCRVLEDLEFDRLDLFPLGLEPSSSDTDDDEDNEFRSHCPVLPSMINRFNRTKDVVDPFGRSPVPNCDADLYEEPTLPVNLLSTARRQLYLLKRNLSLEQRDMKRKSIEAKVIGMASRSYPNSCGHAFRDKILNSKLSRQNRRFRRTNRPASTTVGSTSPGKRNVTKKLQQYSEQFGMLARRCSYRAQDSAATSPCGARCLPYGNVCARHIVYNSNQLLYQMCTVEMAGGNRCSVPALSLQPDVILPRCPLHLDRTSFRLHGTEPDSSRSSPDNNTSSTPTSSSAAMAAPTAVGSAGKKKYKQRYVKKNHRRRKKKISALMIGPYSDSGMIGREFTTSPDDAGDSSGAEGDEGDEYSNQDAQAALASVARDFGFANYDLTDILVRLPDATLLDNILDQEFATRPTEPQVLHQMAAMQPPPPLLPPPVPLPPPSGVAVAPSLVSLQPAAVPPMPPPAPPAAPPSTPSSGSKGGGGRAEIDTIDRALTATAGDHNWADVEQFLMEENYKSTSYSNPPSNVGDVVTVSQSFNMPIITTYGDDSVGGYNSKPPPPAYWPGGSKASSGTKRKKATTDR